MLTLFASPLHRPQDKMKWGSPPHWIEEERRPASSRSQIMRETRDRRRWLRDTGIL